MYEDKIKTDLTGLLSEGVYRIRLLQARDQWQALVNWTLGFILKSRGFLVTVRPLRTTLLHRLPFFFWRKAPQQMLIMQPCDED